jgi:hypothetical protein
MYSAFNVPEFSKILNISFDEFSTNLNALLEHNPDQQVIIPGSQGRMVFYWITESKNLVSPPSGDYKYFTSLTKKVMEINLANTHNGRVIPYETNNWEYHIFLREVKTIAENRDEKLNEIL